MQPLLSRRDIFQKSYQNNLTIVKHTFLNGNGICTSACTELIHFSSANRALIKHISTDYIQQHPKRVGQTSKTHELYAPLHTEPFRQTDRKTRSNPICCHSDIPTRSNAITEQTIQ